MLFYERRDRPWYIKIWQLEQKNFHDGTVLGDVLRIAHVQNNKKYIENGTPKKDPWHWSRCIDPNKVCPPISTHQRQVPQPTEWSQAIGLHHPVAGGQTDQSEREVVVDCQAQ